ncbi:potassium channel family protein [Photobacterium sp. TY1-4]|uniref:potassium channel family protein n=1 Tax=Photobacterium sp. TY1-4 TaxID=2899122 RepID=UPI0021BF3151|nr:potassium channel family protein [Photobacterium sp. TY1-4]UXI02406.1 potassium channel family protein [Photobacterium sp. TY1-4]
MITLFLVNSAIVALTVFLHYTFLRQMSLHIPRIPMLHGFKILFGVLGALVAHSAEVWIFAYAYYKLHHSENWGSLTGNFDSSLLDCVYFSFTTYTTLGFGDIEPVGHLRFLTGVESLTGLVLITWTASFLYLEMQRYWTLNHDTDR